MSCEGWIISKKLMPSIRPFWAMGREHQTNRLVFFTTAMLFERPAEVGEEPPVGSRTDQAPVGIQAVNPSDHQRDFSLALAPHVALPTEAVFCCTVSSFLSGVAHFNHHELTMIVP